MAGEVEFGCLVVDPGVPVQPSPPPAPTHQQESVGVGENPNTWLDLTPDKWFVEPQEILRYVHPTLPQGFSYPLEPSLFLPVSVLSWDVPERGLAKILPDLIHAGQDDFLAPHDAFIPSLDKWFFQAPIVWPLLPAVLPEGWSYPWEPSHYSVPTLERWQLQDPQVWPITQPLTEIHLDVPEWLDRALPAGAPTWQQEPPLMAPPPHMLEEVSIVMPLVTLDDTTFPTTDTAHFGKADEGEEVYPRT